ncbi:uncharacterized protein CEXT_284521 [Caerostris extrusa]|uniref:Uncharacterized protein n=1 Tax=Caerostris extrusa TaxID=172846 RepID=A0AAV4S6B0_CAEEX|nr:uncharacterized protein CEXT_284521 [Caerostris extrusa]
MFLPSRSHQKSVTRRDFDPKPFDFYDHCLQNKPEEGQPTSIRGEKISTILSSLHEKGPLDEPSKIHTDYERSVNDTDCTFLRTMQAVDWKNPEPISKTMYETDFARKFPGYKTLMNDSHNNICRNIPQLDENFEKGDGPSLSNKNKMQAKLKTHSGKNDKCSSHPVCRQTAHIPKFQYSEPLLRDDFAQSSNKRVLQAAKVILSGTDKLPMSETAESLQKAQDLLPEYKAGEQKSKTAAPPKAKSFQTLSRQKPEFPFTEDSYLRSGDLRNIIIPNAYLGYNYDVKSVAKSDFCPKLSLPSSRLKPMTTKKVHHGLNSEKQDHIFVIQFP